MSIRGTAVGGGALLAVLLLGCPKGEDPNRPLLPPQVQALPLLGSETGDKAAKTIGLLHERGLPAPLASEIGFYGRREPEIVLYVSRFDSPKAARSQLRAMAERIGQGRSGFGDRIKGRVDGVEIQSVLGHGQVHYFYAQGSRVTWLGASATLAGAALAELLGVDPGTIPSPLVRMASPGTPPSE